jgi:mannose-1-phosphate guanylyltransferase
VTTSFPPNDAHVDTDVGLALLTQPDPVPDEVLGSDSVLWAVIFAGGIGSRFWPLSTPARPKPVLHLLGERPMLADTVHRLQPTIPPARVLVVTSRDIAEAIRGAIPEIPADNVLVEPRPLGTAAAYAWALEVILERGGDRSVVVAMHADLAVAFPDALRRTLQRAAFVAVQERALVALSTAPTRPETAFGYLLPGAATDPARPFATGGAARVAQFIEKPRLDAAAALLNDGAQWHTGIVVARADDAHEELFARAHELVPGRHALAAGHLPVFAGMVRPVSIERGLLERSPRVLTIAVECGWDDVGTWACLRRARDLDDDGNGAIGHAVFVDSESNVVHTEAGTVVLYGCEKMLVVTLQGLTFVTPLDRAADLKPLLDQLPGSLRIDPTRSS